MKNNVNFEILRKNNSLQDMIKNYPEEWKIVNEEIIEILKSGKLEKLTEFINNLKKNGNLWKEKIVKKSNHTIILQAFTALLKIKLSFLALEKLNYAISTGQTKGNIKFNFINGIILQKLLFYHDFKRKPVSLFWFNLFWKLISQKKILMPLVAKKGIYCFYTKEFIQEISEIIINKKSLEIASGDGTLSSFLQIKGHNIVSTDDYSWNKYINYPDFVLNISAKDALDKYNPEIVICSWPPPFNNFEKHVFETKSVKIYIVIGSIHKFASSNWEAYKKQTDFSYEVSEKLSNLIIPKELDSAVIIFKRKF